MSADRLQKGFELYELSQERKRVLGNLDTLLARATREKIQDLLKLPDEIRTSEIDLSANYRTAHKLLLERYLAENSEGISPEKRELMNGIIQGIKEVDRITAEHTALKKKLDSMNGPSGKKPKRNAA